MRKDEREPCKPLPYFVPLSRRISCISPHFFFVFCMILFFFTLISCQNTFNPSGKKQTTSHLPVNAGRFSLNLAGNNARTILPTSPQQSSFLAYTITFTAVSGDAETKIINDRTNATLADPVILLAGTYDLTVNAYQDTAKSKLVAEGSVSGLVISEGQDTAQTITLSPIFNHASQTGTFSWDITLSPNPITVSTAKMTIKKGGTAVGAIETLANSGQTTGTRTELTPGVYTVTFEITETGTTPRRLVWNELMHVYANLTSRFPASGTHIFTAADFRDDYWDVTFDYDNGRTYEYAGHTGINFGSAIQTVLHGSVITSPAALRPGYKFEGWYTDSAYTPANLWNFANPVHGGMTLYAKWTANTATINISVESIVNGTAGESFPAVSISRGTSTPTSASLSLTGTYTAQSWKVINPSAPTAKIDLGTAQSISLSGTDTRYNTLGGHFLEVTVTKDSREYRVNIPFTIVP
jgi:uncharacterized repeat protein (TIGR02543 family)